MIRFDNVVNVDDKSNNELTMARRLEIGLMIGDVRF